ncbi:MAG: phosphoserine phosphatase SerB [Bdellovibrio sp.]
MSEHGILVTVAGPDQPGITAKLMSIVRSHNAELSDMGQAVTHGLLSLSFVLNDQDENSATLKDLLFEASKMGLNLTYQKVNKKVLLNNDGVEKFILNCIAPEKITAAFIGDLASTLAVNNVNILRIDNVDSRQFKVLEILTNLPREVDIKSLKAEMLRISNTHQIDVAFLKDNVFRRSKRLIVFDMDSTLIQTEVIDELAELAGAGDAVRKVTEAAMNGEIDFDESLRQRVSKLKGLKVEKLQEVLKKLPMTPGAEEFIKTVKGLGYKVALISGGFSYFADYLKDKLGLDYAFANDLRIRDGVLTGEIEGTIINAQQKALLLKVIAQQEKIALEQVVAIGDGANDLPMLSTAGLGIAYHAKDVVKKKAEQHMSHGPMTSILYFLGIPAGTNLTNKY